MKASLEVGGELTGIDHFEERVEADEIGLQEEERSSGHHSLTQARRGSRAMGD